MFEVGVAFAEVLVDMTPHAPASMAQALSLFLTHCRGLAYSHGEAKVAIARISSEVAADLPKSQQPQDGEHALTHTSGLFTRSL